MWTRNPYEFQTTDQWIPIIWNKYGKIRTVSWFCSTLQINSWWEPTQVRMFGNAQIPITRKYSVAIHIISRLWDFEQVELIGKSKLNPEHESSKILYYETTKGKTALLSYYKFWLKLNWVRQTTQFPDMRN